MDGMGFLLSSLGIDTDQLKSAAQQVNTTATDFLNRLERIEQHGKILEMQLNKVIELLDPSDLVCKSCGAPYDFEDEKQGGENAGISSEG